MKKKIRRFLVVCLLICLAASIPGVAFAGLSDISANWAQKQISDWIEQGLIKGNPDGTFKPENPITRAEYCALVNRAFGFYKEASFKFIDVKPTDWYSKDISIAREQGFLKGYNSEDHAGPNNYVTRQEAVVMLARVLKLKTDEASADKFSDANKIASWAKGDVGAVHSLGYINSYTDNSFKPDKNATRAEVVYILYNAAGTLFNKEGAYGPESGTTQIKGNVTVNKPGITISNTVIEGNLYLTEGIGAGTVTLKNVTVRGTTLVSGGGEHSIVIIDSILGNVVINVPDGTVVRLVAQGTTGIGSVNVQSAAKLEESSLTGPGFGEVVIGVPEGALVELAGNFDKVTVSAPGSKVNILSGIINLLEINAEGAEVHTDKTAEIKTLTVNKPSKVLGECRIGTANVNSGNVTIEPDPSKVNILPGLTGVLVDLPSASSGGSSGNPPPAVTVSEVASIADKNVLNGTPRASIGLPSTVEVTLNDNSKIYCGVTWDNGDPAYNGNIAGTYNFTGTLTMPAGVTNTPELKAGLKVNVGTPFVTSITGINPINVPNGTAKENIGLPTSIKATLSDGTTADCSITWNNGAPAYDGDLAGLYEFEGTIALSSGVTNPSNFKANVTVSVGTSFVVSVASIAQIDVTNGTSKENIGLPSNITATLNSGAHASVDITWDDGTPAYNATTAGAYIFEGTILLPEGVTNPTGIKAQVIVNVGEPFIVSTDSLTDINVANGTPETGITRPASVGVILNDGTHAIADISAWDGGTPAYNATTAGAYIFEGTILLPEGVTNPTGIKAQVIVNVGKPFIVSTGSLTDINVANGTPETGITRPASVGVTLNDGTHTIADISAWDGGTPAYNATTAGAYIFEGTILLPEGVTNPTGIKAQVIVNVGKPFIVSTDPLTDINVANGTPETGITRPASVGVTLNDGTHTVADISAWDDGTPAYDGYTNGTYTFTGTLSCPEGFINSSNITVQIKVNVGQAFITAVDSIPNINVVNNTQKAGIGLPGSIGVTLNNGTHPACNVTWDDGTPSYAGTVAGTYEFTGTLQIPLGVANDTDLKAHAVVIVGKPFVVSVKPAATIAVSWKTAKTSIGFPAKAVATMSDNTVWTVDISAWDDGTPAYNPNTAGTYLFSGSLMMPTGLINNGEKKAEMKVIVCIPDNNPNPATLLNTSPGATLFEFDSADEWNTSVTGAVYADPSNFISGSASSIFSVTNPIAIDDSNDLYYSFTTSGSIGGALSSMENLEFNLYAEDKTQIDYILVKFYTDDSHNLFYENGIGGWELSPGWNNIRRVKDDFDYVDSISLTSAMSASRSVSETRTEYRILQEKIEKFNQFLAGRKNTGLLKENKIMSGEDEILLNETAIPSWDNISSMEIFIVYKNGNNPKVNLDRISVNTAGKAKLLFTFDDAWYDVVENAVPILNTYGFKATTWANSGNLGDNKPDREEMNVSDLQYLYNLGWDIGNHTVNHPDVLLTPYEMRVEFLLNQEWLLANGWTRGAYHVCYPSGQYSDWLIDILRDIGVLSARTTDYGIQPTPSLNMYKLKCVAVGRDTKIEDVKREIDRAIATGSTLFFMLHRVEDVPEPDDGGENYGRIAVSTDNFTSIVQYISDYVQQQKLDVVTINEWFCQYVE